MLEILIILLVVLGISSECYAFDLFCGLWWLLKDGEYPPVGKHIPTPEPNIVDLMIVVVMIIIMYSIFIYYKNR